MADNYSSLGYDPRGVPNTRLRQFLFGLDRLATGGALTGQGGGVPGGGPGQAVADIASAADLYPRAQRLGNYGMYSLGEFGKAVNDFALGDPDAASRGAVAPANPNPSTVAPAAPSAGNVKSPDPGAAVEDAGFGHSLGGDSTGMDFPTPISDVNNHLPFSNQKERARRPQFYETRTVGKGGENVPSYTNYDPEEGSPDTASGTPQFSNPESEQNDMIEQMFTAMAKRKMEDPYGIAGVRARAGAEYEATHPGMSPEEMAPLDHIQVEIQRKQDQASALEAALTKASKNPAQDPMYNKLLQDIGQLHENLSTSLQMADFRRGGRLSSATPRMLGGGGTPY